MNLPTPIEHYYKNFHPYEKFIIYEGQIDVEYSNGFSETISNAKIEFTYLPSPRFELSFCSYNPKSDCHNIPEEEEWTITVKYSPDNIPLKCDILTSKIKHGGSTSYCRNITAEILPKKDDKSNLRMNKLKFYLVNYIHIQGESLLFYDSNNKKIYRGRCTLTLDNLKITIDALPDIESTIKFLKRNKTYGITHICELKKIDNSDFSIDELIDILEKLTYYLSFVNGSWTTTILMTGFDSNDKLIWDSPMSFYVESYRPLENWFPQCQYKDFEQLFPQFWQKWNDPQWNDVLKKTINWYVETNKLSITIEGCIVLQQVALEMLANFILVELKKIISNESFNKINASDKIRLLLSQYNFPLNIPNGLPNLDAVKKSSSNWNDAPEAFVQIRNSIVHETSKKTKTINQVIDNAKVNKIPVNRDDVILEIYILGQWYLEIILLKIFDYQGNYVDRTKQDIWKNSIGENFKLLS